MNEINEEVVQGSFHERSDEGHKGTFGTCLIVAGSPDMTGALTLSTEAALRSGTGIVRVFSHPDALLPTRINCPSAVFSSYEESSSKTVRKLNSYMSKVTASAIGPGIDPDDKTNYEVLTFLIENSKNLVIDASALTIISKHREELLPRISSRIERGLNPAILTPHIGEFKRLVGDSSDLTDNQSVQFALQNKCVVVLKNHKTIISDEQGRCYYNIVGNSGMAKGGSGDVLTGLIAGFCAQGMDAMDAAVSGVYFHSRSGILASEELGKRYMLPTDVLDYLADAMNELDW